MDKYRGGVSACLSAYRHKGAQNLVNITASSESGNWCCDNGRDRGLSLSLLLGFTLSASTLPLIASQAWKTEGTWGWICKYNSYGGILLALGTSVCCEGRHETFPHFTEHILVQKWPCSMCFIYPLILLVWVICIRKNKIKCKRRKATIYEMKNPCPHTHTKNFLCLFLVTEWQPTFSEAWYSTNLTEDLLSM